MKNKKNLSNEFLIRANLKEKEKKIQLFWEEIDLLKKIKENNQEDFVILSGPPYANGSIHIGHALNKIIKDLALRFYALNGKRVEYRPGWDMHGLPIANKITKLFPDLKDEIKFRKACFKYAHEQLKNQEKQFKRLGLLMDFSNKYLTCDYKYVANQLKVFINLIEEKKISRKLKPVFWSWSSETALAEAEIIYKDKETESLFFAFEILNQSDLENVFLVAWTTSIWTIPDNYFLAVNKDFTYSLIVWEKKKIIIAKDCLKNFLNDFGEKVEVVKEFKGNDLIGLTYKHSFLNFTSKVVQGEHVSSEEGTGIVHISPSFGVEDFQLAKKLNAKISVSLDSKGFFNEHVRDPDLKNIFYKSAEKIIVEKLKKNKNLLKLKKIIHKYPYDWRTEKPVVYRATSQVYLKTPQVDLKDIILKPSWAKRKMKSSIEGRKEWCISRQRVWGAPIPTFLDNKGNFIIEKELINVVIKKILKERSDDFWWSKEICDILPVNLIKKYNLVGKKYEVFDVWFDSGVSKNFLYPEKNVNLIWEGNDQFRGWFNSLLVLNDSKNKKPFERIAAHGFVNDAKGLKMSKSKGNIIDPLEVCNSLGSDVLRIWAVSVDYFNDVNLSKDLLSKMQKTYLKTRNTIRFLINNTIDFDSKLDLLNDLEDLDYSLIIIFCKLIEKVEIDFLNLNFHKGWKKIFSFINSSLSNFYFDFIKTTLYFDEPNSERRRKIQFVLNLVLKNILILMTPIIPHTCEEAFGFIRNSNKSVSIQLEKWPKKLSSILKFNDKKIQNIIFKLFIFKEIKNKFNSFLEKSIKNKEISSSKNLKLTIFLKKNLNISSFEKEWKEFSSEFYFNFESFLEKDINIELESFLKDKDLPKFLKVLEIKDIKFVLEQKSNVIFKIEQN